jgi:hypothetical protein
MKQCEIRGKGMVKSPDSASLHPGYLAGAWNAPYACLRNDTESLGKIADSNRPQSYPVSGIFFTDTPTLL